MILFNCYKQGKLSGTIVFILLFFFLIHPTKVKGIGPGDSITTYTKYRFGGYGEVLYRYMNYGPDRYTELNGAPADSRSEIGIPRAVFSFDYKFRKDIKLVTELEIENGGTGSALELEYEEAGEYEMEIEKGGEIVLEQFYLEKEFKPWLKLSVGHIIVPVGRLNTYHLPTEYFGTVRPEGERQLLPVTWHETGISVSGEFKKLSYQALMVNGLDANGFSSANWIAGGHQGIFEEIKATSMAFAGRINYKLMSTFRLSLSGYIGNSAKNTSKPDKMKGLSGNVSLLSSDFEFDNRRFIIRGLAIYGNLMDSEEISSINKNISKNIQYPRTPVAGNAATWSAEAGYDVFTHFRIDGRLIPFIRYEYYNSMQKTEGAVVADARMKRSNLAFGVNYYLLKGLALKLDYAIRTIDNGTYNNENTLGFALVYSTYFIQK